MDEFGKKENQRLEKVGITANRPHFNTWLKGALGNRTRNGSSLSASSNDRYFNRVSFKICYSLLEWFGRRLQMFVIAGPRPAVHLFENQFNFTFFFTESFISWNLRLIRFLNTFRFLAMNWITIRMKWIWNALLIEIGFEFITTCVADLKLEATADLND